MKYLLILMISALFINTTPAQNTEAAQVKKTFDSYKTAILNDKAEKALETIDSRTLKYYTEILDAVKMADSSKITSMSLIDKITILSVRARATKDEIILMKGHDLFLFAIKNGMVGKDGVINNSVGDVTVNKNFAKGQLLVNGKKAPLYFHFYKENGKWKIDLTSLFPMSNVVLKKMIEESGKPEDEYIMMLLEAITGIKQSSEIWKPVQ